MTEPTADKRSYACPWCGTKSDASTTSCPACGSPVDVRGAVSLAAWSKLPSIKDMAKIQFEHSFCQIEGTSVPVADFKLAAGEGFYFSRHLILWKDDQVKFTAIPLTFWEMIKRLLASMPLVMTQAIGPGRIAISKDRPGELIALPMQKGDAIDVRETIFMAATKSIEYDWLQSRMWYSTRNGKETETRFPIGRFLDRFTAKEAPGLLLLHGSGNVFIRELASGQSILIKPTSFLFKEHCVKMALHFDYPAQQTRSWFGRRYWQRYIWLRLTGPGRVAIQSHSDMIEDTGLAIVRSEPSATQKQW
jgi:uncharacterized protein (AIM24 family)